MVLWTFSSSTTFGVHVLDLDNFQFSSIGKFQSGKFQAVQPAGTAKSTIWAFLLVWSIIIMPGLLC